VTIATYTDLQTAITDWLHRTDGAFAVRVPDFIRLAEARINRLLNLSTMEIEVSMSMSLGSRFVALPADFNTPITLWMTNYIPRQSLSMCIPSELPVRDNTSARPQYYAIDGPNLAFETLGDQAYPFTFRYTQSLNLSNAVPVNKILQEAPDVYLYGALLETTTYTKDLEAQQEYGALFNLAIEQTNTNQNRNKSLAPLRMEIPLPNARGNRFNINRGY
jgi:hypothetical protein